MTRIVALSLLCLFPLSAQAQGLRRAMTFSDLMVFPWLERPLLSQGGEWIAYEVQPDRGDGTLHLISSDGAVHRSWSRGGEAAFSSDGKWLAAVYRARAIDREGKKESEKPKEGLLLVATSTGDTITFPRVEHFAFSPDARWLIRQDFADQAKMDSAGKDAKVPPGTNVHLRRLSSGEEIQIPLVTSFGVDTSSSFLAYAVSDSSDSSDGLFIRDLRKDPTIERTLVKGKRLLASTLSWAHDGRRLGFVLSTLDEKRRPGKGALWVWQASRETPREVLGSENLRAGWAIPSKNELFWTRDDGRLFFGVAPERKKAQDSSGAPSGEAALFDPETILKERGVDVWHWDDPRIISNQKKRWKEASEQLYRAVYHVAGEQTVVLADSSLPTVMTSENPDVALARSDVPYLKQITWDDDFYDYYLVRLSDGKRQKIASHLSGGVSLSPDGHFVAYYDHGDWYLYDVRRSSVRNLTSGIGVGFAKEDNDLPSLPPSYGLAGWLKNDRAVLIYDRYDLWQIPSGGGRALDLTGGDGRRSRRVYRVVGLDPDQRFFQRGESLTLRAYNDSLKYTALYRARVDTPGVSRLLSGSWKYGVVAKARRSSAVLLTRQSYEEFPDLWITTTEFQNMKRLTDVAPLVKDFAWGSAELVRWKSDDGVRLQGVLIKPGNYEPGKRYPVLVYYYELFSQQLYDFPRVTVSHRPCFPFYASNGYAIFLPDIRYEVGRPGLSAVKCLVPGVQKLVEMGVADPKAIGLHGHSWSGYETAFVITQTNIFAAAIAGAAVANMTSAYSGIRLESGLARQMQYEKQQSRIGGSLWEKRDLFIENSPVFYADRIHTPLLLEFGDQDGAVPWQQGIEMYLAMRRLGKDCILLEYRGEGHHPEKYPNKLDYAMKMKEYLDHYLKGTPAPEWIARGVPYSP